MRNIIIVLVIITVLVFGSVFFQFHISSVTQEYAEKLERCNTRQDLEDFADEWEKHSKIVDLMIDHSEIDLLNQYIWSMQIEIEENQDDYLKSKKLALEALDHIAHRSEFCINNILSFNQSVFIAKNVHVTFSTQF